jgi:hypothetical protein
MLLKKGKQTSFDALVAACGLIMYTCQHLCKAIALHCVEMMDNMEAHSAGADFDGKARMS